MKKVKTKHTLENLRNIKGSYEYRRKIDFAIKTLEWVLSEQENDLLDLLRENNIDMDNGLKDDFDEED